MIPQLKADDLLFLARASVLAYQAGHIFPRMAACEAALESGFGDSVLAKMDNNLFGMKQHRHPIYGTHVLPTREFQNGGWVVVKAKWIHYPSWIECFQDRMITLARLASVYPHYQAALNAPDAGTYVREVSKTWSTDPNRAAAVELIYRQWDPPEVT